MQNAGLDESQAGIKIAGRNINNLRYPDNTTITAEIEEALKCLLIKATGFGWGHECGAHRVGLKRGKKDRSSLPIVWGPSGKAVGSKQARKQVLTENWVCWRFTLGFPSLQNGRNKCCCLSPRVYGTLLKQPGLTKMEVPITEMKRMAT